MARARNIKPSIMDNDILAGLEPLERLLFIFMWMLADREGRLEDRPKRIAAQALPYDHVDAGRMLSNLEAAGFIARYTVKGQPFIQILAFTRHQNPHSREAASEIPPMSEADTTKEVTKHNLGSDKASPVPCLARLIPDPPSLIPDPPSLRSGEKRGKRAPAVDTVEAETLVEAGFDRQAADDFIAHKRRVKAPLTPRAWADHQREAAAAGWSVQAAADKVMARNWKGFCAAYVEREHPPPPRGAPESFRERDARIASERVAEATGGLLGTRTKPALEVIECLSPSRGSIGFSRS